MNSYLIKIFYFLFLFINPINTYAQSIGDSYQGGILFFDDGNGVGLVVSPSDQSTTNSWGCMGTNINGASGTNIGTRHSKYN